MGYESYSSRKGTASYCSTGSTVPPIITFICLRVYRSMRPVREKYIHYKKDGDQYAGRVLSVLNVKRTDIAVSPPHFNFLVKDGGGGMVTSAVQIKLTTIIN